MTDTAMPIDGQVSEILPPRHRRRRIIGGSLTALLLAAGVGVPVAWRAVADSVQLQQGNMSYAPDAWQIRAGDSDEYCFGVVPGGTIRFGVSFHNPSSHPVHITAVAQPFEIYPTTVTMSRLHLRSSDPVGPQQPLAPITLRQGDEVLFYFSLQVPTDVPLGEGTGEGFSSIEIHYQTMNVHFDKQVPIGYTIGFQRPHRGTQPCQPTHG